MGIHTIAWALDQQMDKSADKFVLVAIANHANDETGYAYPSIARIEELTCQNRKTVQRALAALQEAGYISDSGFRVGTTKQIVVYEVAYKKEPKNGSVPSDGLKQAQKRKETGPFLPGNRPVFGGKEAQIRATEPEGTINEPEGTKPPTPAAVPAACVSGFDLFWEAYPPSKRKVGRDKCESIWKRKGLEDRAGKIVEHVLAMRQTTQWAAFCPSTITYLNQGRYNDPVPSDEPENEARAYMKAIARGMSDERASLELGGDDDGELRRRVSAQVARLQTR